MWQREESEFQERTSIRNSHSSDRYVYPECIRSWSRAEDRQASEDAAGIVRLDRDSYVRDAKLYKVLHGPDNFVAIHTASAETLISLMESNSSNMDTLFWTAVISRMEYISTTLSVKKIRLLLAGLSGAPACVLDAESVKEIVHILGRELLYRFHSITPLTCASVASSLAKLGCRDKGTLNILALAFEQHLPLSKDEVSSDIVHDHSVRLRDAFRSLDYPLPVLDSVLDKVLAIPATGGYEQINS